MSNKISGGNTGATHHFHHHDEPAIKPKQPENVETPAAKIENYTIKPGDTLSKLAERRGISLDAILRANPDIKNPDKIYAGKNLKLENTGNAADYTIKRGDTLSELAKAHGTTVGDIMRANPGEINNPNLIFPGQKLRIPNGNQTAEMPNANQPDTAHTHNTNNTQTNGAQTGQTPETHEAHETHGAEGTHGTELTGASRTSVDVLLPASGRGYTVYNRDGNDQYGRAATINAIRDIADAWANNNQTAIQIGDISRHGGGRFAPHSTHQSGTDIDLRPMRADGRALPTSINDPSYSRSETRELVQLIKAKHPNATILFNDPVLIREGLTTYSGGHHNHLHVVIR